MKSLSLIVTAAFFISSSVHAQMIQPSLYMSPQIALSSHASRFDQENRKRISEEGSVEAIMFRYTPSAEARSRNLANFVKETRKTDPAGAAQMEKLFAQSDFIQQLDGHLRPLGLSVNNVADAFAVYWIAAWSAANGQETSSNGPQYKAVSRQAAAGLAATPAFKSATNAERQELAEAMLVQAAMIDGSMEATRNDPAMRAKVGAAVRQGAKKMGLDLDAARLTEDGFVPTGKRSEADVADPGAEPAKMAANAEATSTASAESNVHPAIWALGGAGALAAAYGVGKMMGRKG